MFERVTDPSVLETYLVDASNTRGHAEALVRPRTVEEVVEVVAHCQAHAIPLTVTASRTSTTGAPVPRGGWLLSTERLTRLVEVGHDTATAEAGVILGDLQRAVEARGRLYPPDPTSRDECTLGASIACNASGARSFRYGPTRRWVASVDVVLPTGEPRTFTRGDPVPAAWPVVRWSEPAVKTAAGYAPPADAVDLFVGQEGTLGVITAATVRLTDRPEAVLALLVWFADRPAAVDFARTIRTAARTDPHGPISPCSIEYLDRACLDLARARDLELPDRAAAAVVCEQEVEPDVGTDAHLAAWTDAIATSAALVDETLAATDPPSRQRLRALRHAVPTGVAEWLAASGMSKVGTDLAVPDDALDHMMDRYESAPFRTVLFGHLGDNHLHLNLLPTTAAEHHAARAWYAALAREAVALGGTVSAEHGIGKLKKEALADMVGPEVLAGFRRLKSALDPAWILGRGTLFDASDAS